MDDLDLRSETAGSCRELLRGRCISPAVASNWISPAAPAASHFPSAWSLFRHYASHLRQQRMTPPAELFQNDRQRVNVAGTRHICTKLLFLRHIAHRSDRKMQTPSV